MLHKKGYEVTTYRVDGEYEDGRHPNEVTFTSNLIEDLKRRDFTINAMAYNEDVYKRQVIGRKNIITMEDQCISDTIFIFLIVPNPNG